MTAAHVATADHLVTHRVTHRVARWLSRLAGIAVLAAVLGAAMTVLVLPSVVGGTARTVRSGSMAPALRTGTLIIDRPVAAEDLRVGDIATYQQTVGGTVRLVTHRIVGIVTTDRSLEFTFRGDANSSPDPQAVPARSIRGKVWLDVPHLGAIRDRIAGLRWLLVGCGVFGLGCYSVWQIAGGLRERREAP